MQLEIFDEPSDITVRLQLVKDSFGAVCVVLVDSAGTLVTSPPTTTTPITENALIRIQMNGEIFAYPVRHKGFSFSGCSK